MKGIVGNKNRKEENMKSKLLYPVLALAILALLTAGCTTNEATDPSSPQEPVLIPADTTLDSFEDGNTAFTVAGVTGAWQSGNDSADGGTSSVSSMVATSDSASDGSYSLKLTATINTSIAYPGSNYNTQVVIYDRIGYVTASMVFNNPVSFASNDFLRAGHRASSSGLSLRMFIYDTQNRFVYTGRYSLSTSWANASPGFLANFLVPSSETYTASDVLAKVKKIVFILDGRSYGASSATFDIFLDGILTGII
jgi:hypothetical protein